MQAGRSEVKDCCCISTCMYISPCVYCTCSCSDILTLVSVRKQSLWMSITVCWNVVLIFCVNGFFKKPSGKSIPVVHLWLFMLLFVGCLKQEVAKTFKFWVWFAHCDQCITYIEQKINILSFKGCFQSVFSIKIIKNATWKNVGPGFLKWLVISGSQHEAF